MNISQELLLYWDYLTITSPDQRAIIMRIQFEIKESLANILDQLTHSDFWATEIKEDESGKKIIKIKDLAYNLEAVAALGDN